MRAAILIVALSLASGGAAAKDSVTIGLAVEPPGLDPTAGAAAAISEITWLNIYEGLTRIDEAGTGLPNLAETWGAGHPRPYTFNLNGDTTLPNRPPPTTPTPH